MNTMTTWTRYRELLLWAVITLLAAAIAVGIARVAGG